MSTDHTVIRLHPNDDVVIATRQLMSGARITTEVEPLVVSGRRATRSLLATSQKVNPSGATTRSSAWH
jgi:hypothetical protein